MEKQNEIEALEARLKTLKAGKETPVTSTSYDTGYLDFPPTPEETKEYQKERRRYDNARIITPDFMVDEDTTLEEFVHDSRARKKMLQNMENALTDNGRLFSKAHNGRMRDFLTATGELVYVEEYDNPKPKTKPKLVEKVIPEPVVKQEPEPEPFIWTQERLNRWEELELLELHNQSNAERKDEN